MKFTLKPEEKYWVFCPLGSKKCHHCSDEHQRNVQYVGVIKTQLLEKVSTDIPMGLYCNNQGEYITSMKECPVPAALAVELKPLDELTWAKIKGMV